MNSGMVEVALRRHLNPFANTLIPECEVRETGHKADFMSISAAGYVTEIEVKVSMGDWKADLKKAKWGRMPFYICKFVYLVPEELGIPDFIPDFAGVWHVKKRCDGAYSCVVVKAPKKMAGSIKVSQKIKDKWMSCFYYRYWNQRIYNMQGTARKLLDLENKA